jgi:hypothetical protein
MKCTLVAFASVVFAGNALAQACWSEWERGGEWLIRAGSCTENVSIPNTQKLCRSRVKSDEPRTAASCPGTVKVFHKGQVHVEPVEFRCMGLQPPAAGGAANVFYYGLSKEGDQLDVVRNLCVQFGGTWTGPK